MQAYQLVVKVVQRKESNPFVEVVAKLVTFLIVISDRSNLNEERDALTHDFRAISIHSAEVPHYSHLWWQDPDSVAIHTNTCVPGSRNSSGEKQKQIPLSSLASSGPHLLAWSLSLQV